MLLWALLTSLTFYDLIDEFVAFKKNFHRLQIVKKNKCIKKIDGSFLKSSNTDCKLVSNPACPPCILYIGVIFHCEGDRLTQKISEMSVGRIVSINRARSHVYKYFKIG